MTFNTLTERVLLLGLSLARFLEPLLGEALYAS
jgi:hypothetical protein